jgi:competence protein ComEC
MKKIFLFLIFACVYFLRLYFSQNLFIREGDWVKLSGLITREPYLSGSNQVVYLDQFILKTQAQPRYHYGQSIKVIGRVDQRVIKASRVNFVLINPAIHLLAGGENGGDQAAWFSRLNHSLVNLFNRLLPSPHAGLLAGILLGSKEELGSEFTQNLQQTGTIHLVVASGYNLSVVVGFCLAVLLRYFKRPFAIVFSSFGLLFYLFLAGVQPPLVRASLMAGLTLLAQLTGRDQAGLRGLMLAAGTMLLVSPRLIFDLGFLLSVAATAGLLVIKIPKIPEALGVTFSAQILALPLLFYAFGQFNLLSPLINLLVLPLVPFLMILGAVLTVIGWVPVLGQLAAFLVYAPLEYFVQIINFFGQTNFAVLKVEQVSFRWIIIYYLLIFNFKFLINIKYQMFKLFKIKN